MEPKDEDTKQTFAFFFRKSKNASDVPIPNHVEITDAIDVIDHMGEAALLALLLKMVLKDRITDDEIQLICDVYYHD
jgi:hypothetical protein